MEKEKLQSLLLGDMSYFDEFYQETKQKVFYNIYAILKDTSLSEDALQETYIKFLNNRSKINIKDNVLGYLFVISRNIALDLIKKRKKETQFDDYALDSLHEEKEDSFVEDIIPKMKAILKDTEFEIVIMHLVNEMTHKEIASLLHKPLGTITWAYNNAIKKIRKGMNIHEG